jgi:hypothetical protein
MERDVSYTLVVTQLAVDPSLEVLVGDDNPAFDGVFEFCSISAGGTIGK